MREKLYWRFSWMEVSISLATVVYFIAKTPKRQGK